MAEQQEVPYVVVEKRGSGLGSFLFGAVLGAAAGILFAPKSGEETQRDLKEGARRLRADAEAKLDDLRGEISDVYDRAREDVSDRLREARDEVSVRKRQAEEALRVGRDAARSAREDLERRVAESKKAYKEAVGEETEGTDESEEAGETEPAGTEA